MSAVTDLLDQLVAGRKTVDEVADVFRGHPWPIVRAPAATAEEAFRREQEDPATPPEGGFFDVSLYRSTGKITPDQYEVLADAAAEGMQGGAEDETSAAPGEPPAGGVDPDDEVETHLFG